MLRRTTMLALAALGASPLCAQLFPHRAVHIVQPFAAGGGPDLLLRAISRPLSTLLGQPIIIENRPGAAGLIAMRHAAQQPPDGHHLLMASNAQLVHALLQPITSEDPLAVLAPIVGLGTAGTILLVRVGIFSDLTGLLEACRSRPGSISYASAGIGSPSHLAAATLLHIGRATARHIPMKGATEIAHALLRGDVDFGFAITSSALPFVRMQQLFPLATTAARRHISIPYVPTLQEVLEDELAVQESWTGLWAPVGIAPPVVSSLRNAVQAAVGHPDVQQAFAASETRFLPALDDFATFVEREQKKWANIVTLTQAAQR